MPDEIRDEQKTSKPEVERKPYAKPHLRRIELTIEESLVSGCKTAGETGCTQPEVSFDAGS